MQAMKQTRIPPSAVPATNESCCEDRGPFASHPVIRYPFAFVGRDPE